MKIHLLLLLTTSFVWAENPSTKPRKVKTLLTSFTYKQNREVPLKIYLPEKKPAPVILLSHGLGGSREVGAYLGNYWAERGFLVVAMQHVGSDSSVWKDTPTGQRLGTLKKAANSSTFLDRMSDVPATLDQLETWAADKKHPLSQRMNLEKIGLAGHSYGALTTQALCGQSFGFGGARYLDPRIDAGLALSPSIPKRGEPKRAFGGIKLPMMLMTGTKDTSLIGDATAESRQEVYPALPAGSKYQLVLKDAEHMAFSDARRDGQAQRNPKHHRSIQIFSTAFWEAHLKENTSAKTWLEGPKPKTILEEGDIWLRK